MLKITKIKCIKSIAFSGGHCEKDKEYMSRVSLSTDNYLILTEENNWVTATNNYYRNGLDGKFNIIQFIGFDTYFENMENIYVKNKKELRQLVLNNSERQA